MKGASVGDDGECAARRGVCKDQAGSSVQAPYVQVVPEQPRPISGDRDRER